MNDTHVCLAALLCTASAFACAADASQESAAPSARFEGELLAAARDYRSWLRISDRANFAPFDCRTPANMGAQRSESDDADTHGRKLYFLFAKDPESYDAASLAQLNRLAAPSDLSRRLVGQALVKESWTAVECALPDDLDDPRYFVDDTKAVRTGEQRELFVMLKLDPATPETDDGWVYGTLTHDGARVTSSGRIASCMGCHVDAGEHRLFGLPWTRREARAREQSARASR